MVRADNVSAIFMIRNVTAISSIKHVDIRYKNVNEYVEYWVVKIIFVKSAENNSEILTKKIKCWIQ